MTKIIVNGFKGKLGRVICDVIKNAPDCELAAGIDAFANGGDFDVPVFAYISECGVPADVIIECSVADGVLGVVEYAKAHKTPLVICTTGLPDKTLDMITEAANEIGVLRSANMSLGVNLIADIVGKISRLLEDSGFDIEIVERHHNQKTDAPSGTALLLADAINGDGRFEYKYGRTPDDRKPRDKKELCFHSVRGGTIVGEHSVIFAGHDEVIEIKHSAASKELFAVGAVRAARFMAGKTQGMFDMNEVINS